MFPTLALLKGLAPSPLGLTVSIYGVAKTRLLPKCLKGPLDLAEEIFAVLTQPASKQSRKVLWSIPAKSAGRTALQAEQSWAPEATQHQNLKIATLGVLKAATKSSAVAVSKAARAVQDRTVRLMKEVKELYEGFRLIVFGAASLVRGIPALIKAAEEIKQQLKEAATALKNAAAAQQAAAEQLHLIQQQLASQPAPAAISRRFVVVRRPQNAPVTQPPSPPRARRSRWPKFLLTLVLGYLGLVLLVSVQKAQQARRLEAFQKTLEH